MALKIYGGTLPHNNINDTGAKTPNSVFRIECVRHNCDVRVVGVNIVSVSFV